MVLVLSSSVQQALQVCFWVVVADPTSDLFVLNSTKDGLLKYLSTIFSCSLLLRMASLNPSSFGQMPAPYTGDDYFLANIANILISPVGLVVLSLTGLVVYKTLIRPRLFNDTDFSFATEGARKREMSVLFISKTVLLLLAAFGISYITRSSFNFINNKTLLLKMRFIFAIIAIEIISLGKDLVNAVFYLIPELWRLFLVNTLKSVVLIGVVLFMLGTPGDVTETPVRFKYILLVVVIEAIAIFGALWLNLRPTPGTVVF